MSSSPDTHSISSLGEREARSSPYINMECSFCESSCVCDVPNPTLVQGDLCVSSKMDKTFIVTPINSSPHVCNESLRCFPTGQTTSETDRSLSRPTEDKGDCEAMFPDFAGREFKLSSRDFSFKSSSEIDSCSLSPGEMLIRSNSFCQEELSLIAVSSLEESNLSPSASQLSLPAEFNLLSTTLPDVSKISTERVSEENAGCPGLGLTFIQADNLELLTEEIDIVPSSSVLALPSKSEGSLWKTFIFETSPDLTNKANGEAESLLHVSEFIPEHEKSFVSCMSAIQESDDIHTSTPIQNVGNKNPPLPSLLACTENVSMPEIQLVKEQPICVTAKQCPVSTLTPSLSRANKTKTPRFPKSDFGGVKSKVSHQVFRPARSQQKSEQSNASDKHSEGNNKTSVRITPARVMSRALFATSEVLQKFHGKVNTITANLKVKQSCGLSVVDGQVNTRASSLDPHPAVNDPASAVQTGEGSSENKQASQTSDASTEHTGSQSCASSLEKSPARSGQMKHVSNKIGVRSGLTLGQDKPPLSKARPRSSSESSTSKPPKEKRATLRVTTSFTVCKTGKDKDSTKPGHLIGPSRNKQVEEMTNNSPRDVKKISLVSESNKSDTAGAPLDERTSRTQRHPFSKQGKVGSLSHPPAASPRPSPLSVKQRQGTFERVSVFRTSRTNGKPQFQQKSNAGSQRAQAAEEPSLAVKAQLNGTRPPQTPTRPSLMGPPLTPASRIPRRTPGPSRGLNESGDHSELGQRARTTSVSVGSAQNPTLVKPAALKARFISNPGKFSGPALTTACKPASSTSKTASRSAVSPVKRTTHTGTVGPTSVGSVDKNNSKTSFCQQKPQQQPTQSFRSQNGIRASVPQDERKDQNIQQIKLLQESNQRFEAISIVLQQILTERDEASRKCRELSQELANLQGELGCSVHSSECLEKENEELCAAQQDATERLQEQHQKDLAELEQRLQAAYQAEWDKVHLTYQEEADRCKALMKQQVEELKAHHEAMKLSHEEQLQQVKQQHETSLEELRKVHTQELECFNKTSKDTETALYRKLKELTMENHALTEKLAAEENRKKELAENTQKDSHALYLEQELESLKVVLDLKTKQLHQQEKKLMEVNKLTEKNVKLEESLNKVQQENEDLKARMERHAALSKQLSTEQAVLQESLQKESKVNKRLSMENEELLWKLHNGDLSSPHKVSPLSPSPAFKLQSPRSSSFFSSTPVSPR
ncbi:microtubule-associated tumor suppressor 1 homolog [Austrofundulus limnaeus]|uniref:Microtubule-associated tumor suppressor 1 homolog n=1 Tax=Austrofundulus limnaeus TaxID=52670 RepID=A0A2I4CIN2_AUSLI|nr:PREDICTED: microtubule-associated tumor suppressor 1 homolog [Austrofundulus limnaeus]